jgi:sporulation protein YlmC with PRC-barrel domain
MLVPVVLVALAASASGQVIRADFNQVIENVTNAAYQSALTGFPCKIKSVYKPKMMRVEDLDACVNAANDRIDWEGLAQQIKAIQENERIPWIDMEAALEKSFAARAIPFDRVFKVKDEKIMMPLSNSLLKFLPASSLQELAVFAKNGVKVGTFAGPYTFERAGALAAANTYTLTVFQYTDSKGNLQSPASGNKLLRDNYAVMWGDAMSQPGFRLSPEKLLPKRR